MASKDPHSRQAMLEQAGVAYPRVTNISSKLRSKINRIIKETAYRAIPDYDPGTSIVEAQSGYRATVNCNGILSLRFQNYFFPEQAAHGVTGVSSVTLCLYSGHVYDFSDLFRPGCSYQAVINQIIQAQIVSRQIPLLKPFAGVGPDENYYLTPDSLVIYYQPAEYTPDYYGVLEFPIPYSQISEIADPRGPIGRIV